MDTLALPDDPVALKNIIADKVQLIAELEERVRLMNLLIYAAKSEKRRGADSSQQQFSLFDEAEATVEVAPEQPEEPEALVEIPGHTRKKRGRRPLPVDLPRVELVHDLSEVEKTCVCGSALSRIGEEVSEKLDVIPAKMQVIRHIRYKYACRGCEGVESQAQGAGGAVRLASLPPQIIPKGIVTAGLLAKVLTAKFVDASPFYRQETQFARLGVDISRATMCNWAILAGRAIEPLIELLLQTIRSGPVMGLDETPVQVLHESGRANTSNSYMWVARGGPPGRPGVLFHYAPSRSGDIAKELVGDFQGWVQSDGYSGYEALKENPGVRLQGCLAHARRKFMHVLKVAGRSAPKPGGGTADLVVAMIAQLYAIEKKALEQKLTPEQIKTLRHDKAKPILDAIKELLDARVATTPPQSLLGKAISYARNQWPRIEVYLEDGRLRPDNNLVENAIRPFAVGRKNWLFAGSPRGAKASAAIYSLVETAKGNGLEPYAYLRFLFERLPYAVTDTDRQALLPQNLTPSQLAIPAA